MTSRTIVAVAVLLSQLVSCWATTADSSSSQLLWQFPADTTAVVTGGTKGIGKAIVEELAAKQGVRVLTCARHADSLEQCLAEWNANSGWDCTGVVADVATKEGRECLIDAIKKWLGEKQQLDILINNVGTNIRKPSVDYTEDDIQFIWKTNLESMFALTTACHPLLKRKPTTTTTASVVNIGSVAGRGGGNKLLNRIITFL
jgi:tropinone reductase I